MLEEENTVGLLGKREYDLVIMIYNSIIKGNVKKMIFNLILFFYEYTY